MKAAGSQGSRIVSLDQFRGYAVAGMFLVNFIGGFAVIPATFKHHNTYCSYADTVMPQFFFAVGFAYRLTFLRRVEKGGAWPACRHVIARCLGLILIGAVIYNLDGRYRTWAELQELGLFGFLSTAFRARMWQALVHIGVTSLWVLPVIAAGPRVRVTFMVVSSLVHLLLSRLFFYDWVMQNAWDGGPLGFMTWTIPTLVGSFAYDVVAARGAREALRPLIAWSAVLMLFGYAVSCLNAVNHAVAGDPGSTGLRACLVEPPFVPPTRPVGIWTMSQRAGSISYLTFSAGFSLAVYTLFVVTCDLGRFQLGLFRTFGQNPLAAYLLHDLVAEAVLPFAPKDSPLWYVTLTFLVFFGITYLLVHYLEKNDIYLRL